MNPQDLVEQALALATLPGVAVLVDRTDANLRWASNSLTTNGEMHSSTLTVIATSPVEGGTAVGTVSRQISAKSQVAGIVAAAEEMARNGPPAEDAAPLIENYPHADPWPAPPERTSIEVFADLAAALGEAFASARLQDHLLFGFAEHTVTTTYLGSTTGLRRRAVQPTGRLELNAKSASLADSAWVGVSTRDFTEIDISGLHSSVLERLGWSANKISLPAGRYETLLPPSAVADMMVYLYWTANARDAEEGRNVFSAGDGKTKIGQQLSALPITLRSDPAQPGLECAPFLIPGTSEDGASSVFDSGMALDAIDWVVAGRLNELLRNRAWATKTGRQPAAPIDNLIIDGKGTATLDEMIASTKRGLLLTCLWYMREVDPETLLLTGLTRDGVYLVEDGLVKGAVNNFRFNESPVDLLARVTEVGIAEKTLCREWNDYFTRTVTPPVRVPDFNMSTVSQAS